MPILHTNHGDIDYQDIGTGDTTLFLMPGWCQPKTVFNDFSELAAVFFRVVIIDWRGHGKSSTDGQDFDGTDLLTEALTLIEHLGLTRIVPVSIAHTSWIAVDLVESLKERVPAVIFLDWIMNQPAPEFFTSIREMQHEDRWQNARDHLYEFWLAESDSPIMVHHLKTENTSGLGHGLDHQHAGRGKLPLALHADPGEHQLPAVTREGGGRQFRRGRHRAKDTAKDRVRK